MIVLHVSAECYPMAKAGGLGDVVGALPKYQKTWVMNNGAFLRYNYLRNLQSF